VLKCNGYEKRRDVLFSFVKVVHGRVKCGCVLEWCRVELARIGEVKRCQVMEWFSNVEKRFLALD